MKKQSLKRDALVSYLNTHSRSTSTEVAKFFGVSSMRASVALLEAYRAGVISRQQKGTRGNGAPVYGYFLTDKTALALRPPAPPPGIEPPKKAVPAVSQKSVDLIAQAVEKLVAHIMDGVGDMIEQRLSAAVTLKLEQALTALPGKLNPPPAEESRVKKPTITVVGLLPAQAGLISHEFGEAFNVHFVGSDEVGSKLKPVARQSDRVFTMANFVSHATEDLVRAVGKKPEPIHGGMTRLREVLTGIHAQTAAA